MRSIRKLFDEVWKEIIKVVFINAMLNAVIFFFILHLMLSLFSINVMWSVYASIAYFVFSTYRQIKKIRLHTIEENNPELREILQTANDNMDKDNLMVRAMFRDLMARMKDVSSGSFLDAKKLVFKLSIITSLSIAIVLLATLHVNLGIFDNPFAWMENMLNAQENPENVDLPIEDPLAARIGKENTQITFTPHLNKIDFNKVEDVREERRASETFFYEDDIEGTADAPSNQKAIREAALASEYSQEVKKLG